MLINNNLFICTHIGEFVINYIMRKGVKENKKIIFRPKDNYLALSNKMKLEKYAKC